MQLDLSRLEHPTNSPRSLLDQTVNALGRSSRPGAMPMTETLCHWLPRLLVLYWVLAAGSVVLTVLPLPVPKPFK